MFFFALLPLIAVSGQSMPNCTLDTSATARASLLQADLRRASSQKEATGNGFTLQVDINGSVNSNSGRLGVVRYANRSSDYTPFYEKCEFLLFYATCFIVLLIASIGLSARRPSKHSDSGESVLAEVIDAGKVVSHGPSVSFPCTPVTEQILDVAIGTPHSVALVYTTAAGEQHKINYQDLADAVHHLARAFQCLGVSAGARIVLALSRGVHQVAIVCASMHCGAAWVPANPDYPEHRVEEILVDTDASLFVHEEDEAGKSLARCSQSVGVRTCVAVIDSLSLKDHKVDAQSPVQCCHAIEMSSPALIIYTSGTTGKPKGIEYSHKMVNHGAHAVVDLMDMSHNSVALLKTPYIWAVVEWELFPVLICGGTLAVGSATIHKEPLSMGNRVLAEGVTCLVSAPDVLELLLDVHQVGSQLKTLKHIITVGAGLPVGLANRFAKMTDLTAKLHNVYGTSESSCTTWTVPAGGVDPTFWRNRAPVGVPQVGCSVWVLNDDLEPVPDGHVGEVCFGGQLATGYWKSPELTAKKFVNHIGLGRLYLTGDLGRWRAGAIEICGRKDRQVKIRGVRVEPEEVEAALKTFQWPAIPTPSKQSLAAQTMYSAVKSLGAVACVASRGPSPELVAFVTPALSDSELQLVSAHLAKVLPPHYIPKLIYSRATLPQLPNGKINLQAIVAEANQAVEASRDIAVMTSLGQMRIMTAAALSEQQVSHRCYAYWMLGVLIDHFYCCGWFSDNCFTVQGRVPPWVELFLRQVGNDQTLFGFIMLGALGDTRMQQGNSKLNLRLTAADFFCFILYLLLGFPIPQMLSYIFDGTVTQPACSSLWPLKDCSGHRWYLKMIVVAHVSVAFCQRCKIPGWVHVMSFFILSQVTPYQGFDPCQLNIPWWAKWVFCWLISNSYALHKDVDVTSKIITCPEFENWMLQYLFFYVFCVYYIRAALSRIHRIISRLQCNTMSWAVLACGVSMVAGAFQAAFHYPNVLMEAHDGQVIRWWYVPLEFGINTCQPLLFALAMTWLPFDFSWVGSCSLGIYVGHFYFANFTSKHVKPILTWMQPAGGVAQLLVLLALPLAFMTTLGPLFHYLIVSPMSLIRRIRSALEK